MNKKSYTLKELSDMYSVTSRTIVRHLKGLYFIEKNKVKVPLDVVKLLEVRHKYDTSKTEVRQADDTEITSAEYDVIEGFSSDEYKEFQKRLIEYPLLKKDLEYHRKASESHQRQMEKIINILEQRNYLEAIDKKNLE